MANEQSLNWKERLLEEARAKDAQNAFYLRSLQDNQEVLIADAGVFSVPLITWGVISLVTLVGGVGTYLQGKRLIEENKVFTNSSGFTGNYNDALTSITQNSIVETEIGDERFFVQQPLNLTEEKNELPVSQINALQNIVTAQNSGVNTNLSADQQQTINEAIAQNSDKLDMSATIDPQVLSRDEITIVEDMIVTTPITRTDDIAVTNTGQFGRLGEEDTDRQLTAAELAQAMARRRILEGRNTVTGEVEIGEITNTGQFGRVVEQDQVLDLDGTAAIVAGANAVTQATTSEAVLPLAQTPLPNNLIPDSTVTGKQIIQADPCKDSTFGDAKASINNLFSKIMGPGAAVLNLPMAIKDTAGIIGRSMNKFANKITGALSEKLQQLIRRGMEVKALSILATVGAGGITMPIALAKIKILQTSLLPVIKKLFDGIFCAGKRIGDAIPGAIEDLLTAAIPNILDGPLCAVEELIGALTTKIVGMADSLVGPLLGGVTKVLGFGMNVKNFLLEGVDFLGKVSGFFNCGETPDCPANTVYRNSIGDQKDTSVEESKKSWQTSFKKAAERTANLLKRGKEVGRVAPSNAAGVIGNVADSISEGLDPILGPLNSPETLNLVSGASLVQGVKERTTAFEETYGEWSIFGSKLGDVEEREPDCNAGNVFECGLPKVEFFGGGGIGGAARVLIGKVREKFNYDQIYEDVRRTASIVGIEMADGGSGYTSPPIVTITDSCDRGYGAYASANIDQNPQSPTYGQILSVSMITVGENYPAEEEEVPLYVDGVVIDNPGEGYQEGDTLDNFKLTIVDGEIKNVTIINRLSYNDLPELNINTELGFGAVLRPLMSKTRPQGEVLRVIDCVGKV